MGDNQQLLNLLSLPNVLLDPSKQQEAVTQLCQLMNTDCDAPQIVQPCIKLLSSHQPLTRIVVMTLVQRHVGRNPDILPQATNALLKCAVDPNPAVRRAAVSTLACMPGSADISLPVVVAALRDPHPSVQRAAVTACRLLPKTNPLSHIDHVDELYRLIRSEDPLLVHSCLMTLDVILAAEGGVVINRAMVRHLSGRSRSLPDAVLVDVLRLLKRYQPGSDEERLALMNRLDWLLTSPAPHLIEAALGLFFHLCSGPLTHLRADVVSRAAGALCGPGDSAPELRWAVLELVRRLSPELHRCFCPHYRYFVPRPSDGGPLSARLVQFLWRLAGPGSSAALVRELTLCLASAPLRGAAVRSLLRAGRRQPQLAPAIVEPLCRLAGGGGGGGGGAALVAGALNAADLAPLPQADRLRLLAALLASDLTALPPPALCRLLAMLGRWGGALPTLPARLRQLAHCGEAGAAGYGSGDTGAASYRSGETGAASYCVSDTNAGSYCSGETVAGSHYSGDTVASASFYSGDAGASAGGGDSSLSDPAVRRALLECTARLFVLRPAELQLTLGRLLERAAAAGGEPAAAAARLYAALELTGGRELLDGTEAEEPQRGGEDSQRGGEDTVVDGNGEDTGVARDVKNTGVPRDEQSTGIEKNGQDTGVARKGGDTGVERDGEGSEQGFLSVSAASS